MQLVISDLTGPEQNYARKGRSIRDDLHLCEILEGLVDGTKAALVNLDQSKVFDRVDQQFFAIVVDTTGYKPEFSKWINMMYHNAQAEVHVNGKRLETFAIERSVGQGFPLSPSSLCPCFGAPASLKDWLTWADPF